MIVELFRGLLRLRIAAPLAVFEERIPIEGGLRRLKEALVKREEREKEAIQKFLSRVKRDPELYGILRFYGLTETSVREIIGILMKAAVPSNGIAVPFVLEMCAHLLSTPRRSEVSADTCAEIWQAYRSPAFINGEQRERFVRIFGPAAIQ